MPEISNFPKVEIFFEFFENYSKDFPKIDQTRFREKMKLIWRFTMFFFRHIAELNCRGDGKSSTFFWKKKRYPVQ